MSAQRSAFEFILLGAIWGSSFLFMRFGLPDFGPVVLSALRVVIAALALLPLLMMRGQLAALRDNAGKVLLVGVINSALPFVLFAYALGSISTGLSAILNASVPLFGALVAWLWLREALSPMRVAGLMIGFAGVVLLTWGKTRGIAGAGEAVSPLAVAAALMATLCYGISASYAKRHLGGLPSLVTATGSQIGASIALALPAWWLWPEQAPGAVAWGAVLVVGLVCTAMAYILYFRMIEHAGPGRALTVTFLIPVFAVFYGAVFLGEAVTPWMLGCGVVIVSGTALSMGMLPIKLRPARKGGT
ncbi:MAG: DMT family transporter [Burkholderiaceae bacterium]